MVAPPCRLGYPVALREALLCGENSASATVFIIPKKISAEDKNDISRKTRSNRLELIQKS